jgi:predicted nucleotidyltransferase
MNTQLLKDKLPDLLSNLKEVSLVYLFGSRAEGRLGPMSDYDLGVLIDRTAHEGQVHARLTHKLSCALGADRIDVLLLNRAPIGLAYAIIAQGEVLYQRDVAVRVEYEAQVMNLYGDYLPVLRAQRDDILRREDDGSRIHRYRAALGRTDERLARLAPLRDKQRTDLIRTEHGRQ